MYNLISQFSPGTLISGLVNVTSDYRWDHLFTTYKVWDLAGHCDGDEVKVRWEEQEEVREPWLAWYFFFFPPSSFLNKNEECLARDQKVSTY